MPKTVLRLPDLDQAKSTVLNGLTSADAERGFRHAIDEFMEWDCSKLWLAPDCEQLKGKRDRALLAVLLACGLRRHEAVDLESGHIQQRGEHWALEQIQFLLGHVSI